MQRVVVLGRGGEGKSVLAGELGRVVNLPVVELDREFWSADFEPMPLDVWRERQQTMAEEPRWIMDGDLGPYDDPAPRLRRADTVVVIAMPLWLCTWRALRRGPEQRDFWRWALRWRRQSRPHLMAAIATHAPVADVVVLQGPGRCGVGFPSAPDPSSSRRTSLLPTAPASTGLQLRTLILIAMVSEQCDGSGRDRER